MPFRLTLHLSLILCTGFFAGVASAATVDTLAMTDYNTVTSSDPPLEDRDTIGSFTTDQVISGPVGQISAVEHEEPSIPGRTLAVAFVESVARFGSRAESAILEGLGAITKSSGSLLIDIMRPDASITEIPFSVTDMVFSARRGTIAATSFSFSVVDTQSGSSTPIDRKWGSGSIASDGMRSVEGNVGLALDSGTGEAELTLETANGFFVTNDVIGAILPELSSSLDISTLDIGREYQLVYEWETRVEGSFGLAAFTDPIDLTSGITIDPAVLRQLTDATVPPASVPLPATVWLMLWAIGCVAVAKGRFRWASG